MKRSLLFVCAAAVALAGFCGVRAAATLGPVNGAALATGVVFDDRNRNGTRDPGEPGLRDVRVSNGREIVRTDGEGRWRLPAGDDTIFFVIKPRGWMTPLNERMLPQFYYIHKPQGSPRLRFRGVRPTGALPASINFPLHRQREPERFRAVFWADPQPRDQKEIDYIAHDVVEELVGVDASFGVTLGDILFDDLLLFENLNGTVALIGIPWYNVIGNHDINQDAPNDRLSDETFERHYGPSYYSFDHGPVHFIVLDDIEWTGATPTERGRYSAGLGPDQIEWIRNDLKLVPREQLVVLMMHIPLNEIKDRQDLYRLIEERPYTMSISGHTHYQEHRFITRGDGWRGPEPHHHIVNVTVSGSWWSGAPDERGIPHTLMRDGAPNGYSILTFDGRRYSVEFKAAGRSKAYQMNIYAPEVVPAESAAGTEVLANVFAGSERSVVEMRVAPAESWSTMEKVDLEDPAYARLKSEETGPNPPAGRRLPAIRKSGHMWRGALPSGLASGIHRIEVRAKDMFGKTLTGRRVIRVVRSAPHPAEVGGTGEQP
jgi:hypothetical protein